MARRHYLESLEVEVNKTHSGLGLLSMAAILSVKARRCLLIIGLAGTGKSTACRFITVGQDSPRYYNSLTRSSLTRLKDDLKDYTGLVVVDDLGGGETSYATTQTAVTLAELCYSHTIRKYTVDNVVAIENFHGSVVLNTQPIKLSEVYLSDDWDAVAVNKIMRFYHLCRPLKANPLEIPVKIDWGLDLDSVKPPETKGYAWTELMKLATIQWDTGRSHEHVGWLLRASAALDRRREIKPVDYRIVSRALASAKVEFFVMDRIGFSSGKLFRQDVLELVTEIITHRRVTLTQLCRDFKMTPNRVSERLQMLGDYFVTVGWKPKTIAAHPTLIKLLKGVYF